MRSIKALVRRLLRPLAVRIWIFLRDSSRTHEEDAVRARYQIDPTVTWQEGTYIFGQGRISIGQNTYIGHNCHISSSPAEAEIRIGKGCALAHSIHVRTTNYARVSDFAVARTLPSEWANITIGDYVWIGCHVYINAGVTIGSNSIIGANSVVTKDVPPDSVVAGSPARVLHHKSSYAIRKRTPGGNGAAE